MSVKENTRQYSHQLRKDYDKFGERKDFTQTVFFFSGLSLEEGSIKVPMFYLNDQISQF